MEMEIQKRTHTDINAPDQAHKARKAPTNIPHPIQLTLTNAYTWFASVRVGWFHLCFVCVCFFSVYLLTGAGVGVVLTLTHAPQLVIGSVTH